MKKVARKKMCPRVLGLVLCAFFIVAVTAMPVAAKAGTWQTNAVGTWYQHTDGTYTINDWEKIDGNWYWFDGNGYSSIYPGWQLIRGEWYYLNAAGTPQTGWQYVGNEWYYLNGSGVMQTGWQRINGNWYYLAASGKWIENNTHETGSLKGIDVSKWQGSIDWTAVKNSGIQFAFIRVAHGDHSVDSYYNQNMKDANAVGLPVGVYFYSTATTEAQSILDAQFVIENLKGYTVSYPVVIDVEDREGEQGNLTKAQVTKLTKAFCDEIRAAGYTPMMYCDEDWYRSKIDDSQLQNVEKWIARYNVTYDASIPRAIWQCGSSAYIDGISGRVDVDFGYKDYTQYITPRTGPVETYVKTTGMWQQNATGYWYQHIRGGYPANCWENIAGKWYWFNAAGYMTTGWQYINNTWYYMDDTGAMVTGWRLINNVWYYMDASGAMQTGWELVNNTWYYMNASGAMQTGWLWIGNTWYYLTESGAMATGWKLINNVWYYMDASGAMQTGWELVNNTWYYMNASGAMQTGWLWIGNTWYYLTESGAMATGWQWVNGKCYYLYEGGAMAANTWIGAYYVDASGAWTQTR